MSKSLLAGNNGGDPPPGDDSGGAPPPSPPPGGDNGDDGGDERPDWLPETLWKDGSVDQDAFAALLEKAKPSEDLPSAADAYTLPEIEGFDHEQANASPLFAALREAAFDGLMGQAQFDKAITRYVELESKRVDDDAAAERAKLGERADNRLKAVETWLGSKLRGDELEAMREMATTAAGVSALERLMNAGAGPKPRDMEPNPEPELTEADVRSLMNSEAYSGPPGKRDPAVVAKVDAWYEKKYGTEAYSKGKTK